MTESSILQVTKDYERMFASAAIPIFGIDLDGKVIEWNPATANCLGLEPSEVNFFPSTAKIFSVVPGRKSDWMFLHSSPCSCTALCSVLPPPALSRLCLSLSLARALSLSRSFSLSLVRPPFVLLDLPLSRSVARSLSRAHSLSLAHSRSLSLAFCAYVLCCAARMCLCVRAHAYNARIL